MAPSPSPPSSAGILLALAIVAGAAIGIWRGQPSAGLLIGVAAGGAIILAQWLLEQRR